MRARRGAHRVNAHDLPLLGLDLEPRLDLARAAAPVAVDLASAARAAREPLLPGALPTLDAARVDARRLAARTLRLARAAAGGALRRAAPEARRAPAHDPRRVGQRLHIDGPRVDAVGRGQRPRLLRAVLRGRRAQLHGARLDGVQRALIRVDVVADAQHRVAKGLIGEPVTSRGARGRVDDLFVSSTARRVGGVVSVGHRRVDACRRTMRPTRHIASVLKNASTTQDRSARRAERGRAGPRPRRGPSRGARCPFASCARRGATGG